MQKKDEIENKSNENIDKMISKQGLNAFHITDQVADGIYIINKDGIVVAINEEYTEITGVKEEDIVGKHMQDVWNEKGFDSETAFAVLNQDKNKSKINMLDINSKNSSKQKARPVGLIALEEKKKIAVITTIERNNKTVLMSGIPFFDEQGEITQVMTIIRDLTQLIELKNKIEEIDKEKDKYKNELRALKEFNRYKDLIGESADIERIKNLIDSVAKTDATVLITGETGVGKEVVARELYANSKRKNGPYVKVNCAAIPENLLESELFGYEKGAFTGAQQKEKLGLFEVANNGTILLDEIGEMPYRLQSKLLRVLQEMEIKKVGGTRSIKIDVRVLAATNENLQEQIKKGKFREDLYYRLNVIPIEIPPLRERKEDITILSHNFIGKFNKLYAKNKIFQMDAIEMLENYNWPGNVRELENTIQRLVIIGDEKLISKENVINILGKEKFSAIDLDYDNISLKDAVKVFEKNIVEKALKKYGSTYKAATALGIEQSTVVRKAKALGIKNW